MPPQVTTLDDALAVLEENGDPLPHENSSSGGRGTASLERGLSLTTRGSQAIQMSQKGKKDTLFFTLGVSLCFCFLLPFSSLIFSSPPQILQRRIQRADRLALASSELEVLEMALSTSTACVCTCVCYNQYIHCMCVHMCMLQSVRPLHVCAHVCVTISTCAPIALYAHYCDLYTHTILSTSSRHAHFSTHHICSQQRNRKCKFS